MSEIAVIEIPEGWVEMPLEDCVDILDSQRVPLNSKQRSGRIDGKPKSELFPYYGATGAVGLIDDFIFEGEHLLIGEDAAPFFDKSKTVAYIANGKFWVNNHAHILNANSEITSNKYLLYYLNKFNYRGYVNGTTRLKLNQGNLKIIPVPLPSLEQQKRIVAKIEELFSHIDAGIEALNKAKQLLKQYRQSVLKAAVTGELLGYKFSEEMFKPIDFGLETLGQGWSPRCEKEPSPSEDTWGVIKTTAVQSLEYRQEENKRLPDSLEPRPKHEVLVGDLLVTRAGPRVRVGICCLVKETRKKLMICDKVYRLRVKKDVLLPEYLEFILNAPNVLSQVEKLKSGINDSGVNLTQNKFVQLQIPYPSIEEQKILIQMVSEKVGSISRLDKEIEKQLLKSEKNKQSILASAFSGELSFNGFA